jgi:hypothetical protein
MTPGTQDNRVVCRALNPNEARMSVCWFVNELGTLSKAEKRAKSHVLGSVRASIILKMYYVHESWNITIAPNTYCSFLNRLFSTPVWFSCANCKIRAHFISFDRRTLMRCTAFARSSGVRNQAFVGESGNKNLHPTVMSWWKGQGTRDLPKLTRMKWQESALLNQWWSWACDLSEKVWSNEKEYSTIATVQTLWYWCAKYQS